MFVSMNVDRSGVAKHPIAKFMYVCMYYGSVSMAMPCYESGKRSSKISVLSFNELSVKAMFEIYICIIYKCLNALI